MVKLLSRTAWVAGIVGAVIGVAAVLLAEQVDHYTSTEAFCGSTCHSMQAYIVDDPVYAQSTHRRTPNGVVAGCADCHLPPEGIVPKTWAHVVGGIKDVTAELLNDFGDPAVWEARRARLAYAVRDHIRETDSENCRACHDLTKIAVATLEGQRAHARSAAEGHTCIQCHFNLVHSPVPPRPGIALRETPAKPARPSD